MRKSVRCIRSIQHIMEIEKVTLADACNLQEDFVYDMTAKYEAAGWELESVSGSPEQGLLMMFRRND